MPKLPAALTNEAGYAIAVGQTETWPYDSTEYVPDLIWPLSIHIYDRMSKEAHLSGVLRAITLPIRQLAWRIDPRQASETVARRVAAMLHVPLLNEDKPVAPTRSGGQFMLANHIPAALMALRYGHMPFEQRWRIGTDGLADIANLSPRLPSTLQKIRVARDGTLEGIDQYPSSRPEDRSKQSIPIDADRLVYYAIDREGGNWLGQSLLRTAWGPYYVKNRLVKVNAQAIERNAMGIPTFETAAQVTANGGDSPANNAILERAGAALRAGEQSYLNLAGMPGTTAKLMGVTGSLPDALPVIRYCDEQMSNMLLEQFLMLGQSSHGSRALGGVQRDFFTAAIQAIADELADTLTTQLVERAVDLNWGPQEAAPSLVPADVDEGDETVLQAVAQLVTSGAIDPDDDMEDWLRGLLRAPLRTAPRPEPAVQPAVPAQKNVPPAGGTPVLSPVEAMQARRAARVGAQPALPAAR